MHFAFGLATGRCCCRRWASSVGSNQKHSVPMIFSHPLYSIGFELSNSQPRKLLCKMGLWIKEIEIWKKVFVHCMLDKSLGCSIRFVLCRRLSSTMLRSENLSSFYYLENFGKVSNLSSTKVLCHCHCS